METATIENDAHLVVRETAPWKVRERWAQTKLTNHQMMLERELVVAHITEHLDNLLDHPLPIPERKTTRLEEVLDNLAVYWCRFFHREPSYRRGDQFSVCPTCKRQYAIPFADEAKVPANVYMPTTLFPAPTKTTQAICRNGLQGQS